MSGERMFSWEGVKFILLLLRVYESEMSNIGSNLDFMMAYLSRILIMCMGKQGESKLNLS